MSTTTTSTDFVVPIRAELEDFEARLHATVGADLGPVAEAMEQILEAGGKRLRPERTVFFRKESASTSLNRMPALVMVSR